MPVISVFKLAETSVILQKKGYARCPIESSKEYKSAHFTTIEALRQATPPVYQAVAETSTRSPRSAQPREAQYELALLAPEIKDTQSETPPLPGTPWNRGCIVGAKLPLKPKHVWSMRG